MYSFICE